MFSNKSCEAALVRCRITGSHTSYLRVCVYKHQCTFLCRSPVCSANRLTTPTGLSPAAASFLGQQISVPLRDPGPSHSEPAEACHVTDTHLSPPWNKQRCLCDTWCITWYQNTLYVDGRHRRPVWYVFLHYWHRSWAVLMGIRTLMGKSPSLRSEQRLRVQFLMGVLFSLRLAAWCLLNVFVMLLHEDQTELGKRFFKMRPLFFFFFSVCASAEGAETLGRFKSFSKDQQTSYRKSL